MISRIALRWRWLRRIVSRNVWSARLMGVKTPHGEAAEPGLVMIQIDGLSRTQFEKALEAGRLPFLGKLIRRKHFTLETFYSGVPSTTPAVQGELFFGVRTAVPAFQFLRRSAGRDYRMYEADAATDIEEGLLEQCDSPLLKDGHAYSNIYRAGAGVTRYCSRDFAAQEFFRRLHPLKMIALALIYLPKLLRMTGLAVLEVLIAFVDAVRGLYEREGLFRELAFVPARVAVCVVLREAIRFRVLMDIERGVRVIQANFLGYDEQAHRRGPGSAFAHWSLKAIDSAVRDIYKAAHGSRYRDYELIIYSDHGQETSIPYPRANGRELDEAVKEAFSSGPLAGTDVWMRKLPDLLGNTMDRCRALFGIGPKERHHSETKPDPENQIVVTAMGPLGHVYLPTRPDEETMAGHARDLVYKARIPLVMFRGSDGVLHAFNRSGTWTLPDNHTEVLGENHPFGKEAAEDLARLAEHPDAGDLMISGWSPDQPSITFPMENGSHGGPGTEETRGFLLVPDRIRRWHVAHISGTGKRVRGEELRQIALHYLGRDGERQERVPEEPGVPSDSLRVMTYNIHSCVGVDSKIRPERVARVINAFNPDIVAVQEVDCHRQRSGGHDQARLIADHLRMSHVFEAMLVDKKERYGIAIFSRYPVEVMKSGFLTEAGKTRFQEARGAIWVKLQREDHGAIHFVNTHFGLGKKERILQLQTLAGTDWLGAIPPEEPVVLCGDFNTGPKSRIFRMLTGLKDAQLMLDGFKPRPTFFSTNPVLRLDHVFVSNHFKVRSVDVPSTPTARVASDHLPLCVELDMAPHGTEN